MNLHTRVQTIQEGTRNPLVDDLPGLGLCRRWWRANAAGMRVPRRQRYCAPVVHQNIRGAQRPAEWAEEDGTRARNL